MPSPLVSYPLPEKDHSLAFITCIYGLENGLDYRAGLLEPLFTHLQQHGYRRVQAIAGERTAYPNGPAVFFRNNGFLQVAEIDKVMLREG